MSAHARLFGGLRVGLRDFGISGMRTNQTFSLLPIFLLQLLVFYQASFEWKNFRESVNEARNTYRGQAMGGKGKFSSEFFTKILKRFGAYFKLHEPNHTGLGIVRKVSSCSTI